MRFRQELRRFKNAFPEREKASISNDDLKMLVERYSFLKNFIRDDIGVFYSYKKSNPLAKFFVMMELVYLTKYPIEKNIKLEDIVSDTLAVLRNI